jgi:cation:H+ antiporter
MSQPPAPQPAPSQPPARRGTRHLPLAAATALTLPGAALGAVELFQLAHPSIGPPVQALVFGLAVVGAAFLLSWAAEAAQLDVSMGLAIGALALVAVLPEYAVGFVFAWKGGHDVAHSGAACTPPGGGTSNCALALANMTGANRLLIGVGWALVVLLAWWRWRRLGFRRGGIQLARSNTVELAFLCLAGVWGLILPPPPPGRPGPVRLLGRGDPAGRRAFRRVAGGHRRRAGREPVPAGAVARAARVRGA